ncbi:rhomboid family intramembrane serine protease [Mesorhizobium sp. UC22_110]|uniref:rhomboid family intramembrane serine protease n=1 Tax=unclassified Mesorhizobium TaxID=325217 RepID=UPI00366AD024
MNEARETGTPADDEIPSREPIFNLPVIVLAIILICAAVHLLRLYVLTSQQDIELLIRAAFIPVRYSGQYDLDFYAFSSPFTYTFLHGGWAHLIVNMIWLAAFGSPLANRIGVLRFALFFAVTGVAAAFFFFAIHPQTQAPLIGASGSISGMMGAAARFAFHVDRSSGKGAFAGPLLPFSAVFRSRATLSFLAVWMVINIVTGVVGFVPGQDSQIAWEAHIGGFLAGFLGLRFFDRKQVYGR